MTRPDAAPIPEPRNGDQPAPIGRQPAKCATMPASAAASPIRPRNKRRSAPIIPSTPPPWRTRRAAAAASIRANCLIAVNRRNSKIKPMTKFIAESAFNSIGSGAGVRRPRGSNARFLRHYANFILCASATTGAAPPGQRTLPASAQRGRPRHRPRPRATAPRGAPRRPRRRRSMRPR